MQVRVLSNALHKPMSAFANVVAKRAVLPAVYNILCHADNDRLTLVASNLSEWLMMSVDAVVETPGKALVPFTSFRQLLSHLKNVTLQLQVNDSSLSLSSPSASYQFPHLDPDEFPIFPECPANAPSTTLPAAVLAESLSKVLFAASEDPTVIYSGVHFRYNEKDHCLDVVATDAYRLARFQIPEVSFPSLAVTVSATSLKSLQTLLALADEVTVRLDTERSLVHFETDRFKFCGMTLSGIFPNYQAVLDQIQPIYEVTIRTDRFRDALARLASVFTTKQSVFRLRLSAPDATHLTITALPSEQDYRGSETLDAEWTTPFPPDFAIDLQWRYLSEFVKITKDDEIVMQFQDENTKAVLLSPKHQPNFTYLVMPLQQWKE